MSQIVFKKISINNFLSIGPIINFDFNKHNGLNYVFGTDRDIPGVKNGIGKSLIFVDALLYILYGKTSKDINKKFLFNRQTPKTENMNLSLSLQIDSDEYIIETGLNKPLTSCTTYFRLYKNGNEIPSKSSVESTREYFIKEIFKIDYNILKNSVILTSCDTQNFFLMNKSQKREFIENIFNLKKFGEILKRTRDNNNSISKEILLLQTKNNQLIEDINTFINLDKNFEIDKSNEINKITNNIQKEEESYNITQNNITTLKSTKESIKIVDLSNINDKRNIINDKIKEIHNNIANKTNNIDSINRILKNNEIILNTVCNLCKDNVLTKLNLTNYNDIINESNKFIELSNIDYNKYKDALNKIEEIINLNQQNKVKVDNIQTQINKYENLLIEISSNIKNFNKNKIDKLNEQSSYIKLITEYKEKQNLNDIQLSKYYKTKKYLELIEHIVSEEGVKKFIINDLVTVLNNKIKNYLNLTGAFYTCIFDNNFNAEFITATGPCTYENFSTGEKSRINICVLFAFKDMLVELSGINSSIMVIDEFLDNGICQYGVEAIIGIIKQITEKNNQTVFLISHRGDINEENFNNIIELEKINGFTKIYKDNQGEAKNANV